MFASSRFPFLPTTNPETKGSNASLVFKTEDSTPMRFVPRCNRGWWFLLQGRLRLQFDTRCSLPAFFETAVACMIVSDNLQSPIRAMVVNLWHWSTQWSNYLHIQHLYVLVLLDSSSERWWTPNFPTFLKGAVARIVDFISAVIHSIKSVNFGLTFSLSK